MNASPFVAAASLAALSIFSGSMAHGADEAVPGTHLVSLSDLESVSGKIDVATIDLSADGRRLAYALGRTLTVIDVLEGRPLWEIGEGFLPSWSPDGRRLAFYSARAGDIQLFVADLAAHDVSQVTHVADGIDPDPTSRVNGFIHDAFRYAWSPDGTRLVFSSRVAASAAAGSAGNEPTLAGGKSPLPLVLTPAEPPVRTLQGVFAQPMFDADSAQSTDGKTFSAKTNRGTAVLNSQLFVVNVRTHVVRRLTTDNSSYFNPAWSPGADIICASVAAGGPIFRAESTAIVALQAATGRQVSLSQGDGIKYRPSWAGDGSRFAYLASQHAFSRVAIYAGNLHNDVITEASEKLDRQIYDYRWSADGKAFLVRYRDGVSTPLSAIDPRSGRLTEIAGTRFGDSPLAISAVAAARSGAIAWLQQDIASDGVLRYSAPGKAAKDLVDLYPQMQQWRRGQVEIVRWTNGRGDEMEGTLLKPVGYESGRRYPLIVDAYPMAGGSNWTHPLYGNQAWAALGYAVFRPSPRAPVSWVNGWKSQASSLAGKGVKGWDVAVDDVLSGVDELIHRGIVDPDRMCLHGHSSGGGVVDYLVTRTDRFKCAVSVSPALSDWVREVLLQTDASWVADWAGASLWNDPNAYVALSAVFHTNLVKTPMLIAVGDKDIPALLDSIEMFNGLRVAGQDVTLLRYPGEGHSFAGEALRDFYGRETEFFAKYLQPVAAR